MPKERNDDENGARERPPVWETVVMAASFGLLWLWFIARQNSLRTPQNGLSPWWQVVLGAALLALIVIMVRRLKRVKRALEENDPRYAGRHGYHPMPFGFTRPHGTEQNSTRKNGKS